MADLWTSSTVSFSSCPSEMNLNVQLPACAHYANSPAGLTHDSSCTEVLIHSCKWSLVYFRWTNWVTHFNSVQSIVWFHGFLNVVVAFFFFVFCFFFLDSFKQWQPFLYFFLLFSFFFPFERLCLDHHSNLWNIPAGRWNVLGE